jgi:hypothetical protein
MAAYINNEVTMYCILQYTIQALANQRPTPWVPTTSIPRFKLLHNVQYSISR